MKVWLTIKHLAVSLTFLTFSSAASAATFSYEGYGGFLEGSASGNNNFATLHTFRGTNYNLDGNSTWTELSWGDPAGNNGRYNGQSGLRLYTHLSGTVDDDGINVGLGDLRHYNEPIYSSGGSLQTVYVYWRLRLLDGTTEVYNEIARYQLNNWETPNDPNSYTDGICPRDEAAGTVMTDPETGYDYVSDGGTGGTGETSCSDAHDYLDLLNQDRSFVYQGKIYTINILGFYDALDNLDRTFWSAESASNINYVRFNVTSSEPVLTLYKRAMKKGLEASEEVEFRIRLYNYGANNVALDDIQDYIYPSNPALATYVVGSSKYDGTAVADPAYDTGTQTLTWTGPFQVPTGREVVLSFRMLIPGDIGLYEDEAVAHIGSVQIDTTQDINDDAPAHAEVFVGKCEVQYGQGIPPAAGLDDDVVYTQEEGCYDQSHGCLVFGWVSSAIGDEMRVLRLYNSGDERLDGRTLRTTGEHQEQYSLDFNEGDNPCGSESRVLDPGEECTIGVHMTMPDVSPARKDWQKAGVFFKYQCEHSKRVAKGSVNLRGNGI